MIEFCHKCTNEHDNWSVCSYCYSKDSNRLYREHLEIENEELLFHIKNLIAPKTYMFEAVRDAKEYLEKKNG